MAYEQPTYRSLPPREAPPRRALSQQQAENVAFRLCQDRGLRVDRVALSRLDGTGRWHVTLEGSAGDRAAMLLDGRDGKLLKGRFHQRGGAAGQPAPAPPGPSNDQARPPPPAPDNQKPPPPAPDDQQKPPPPASPGADQPPPPPPPPAHDDPDELD
jgi:hypothetical protein